jgi:integral membrane protein
LTAALNRFRIASYVVGIALLTLTLVAMPMKYLADSPGLVAVVSPIHGFMYMVYVVLTFDLGRRAGWPVTRTVPLMLAGTIPFVSFYAERRATEWVREPQPAAA